MHNKTTIKINVENDKSFFIYDINNANIFQNKREEENITE
jgi:hypothetical protein